MGLVSHLLPTAPSAAQGLLAPLVTPGHLLPASAPARPWEQEHGGSSGVKCGTFERHSCRADVWWEQGDGKGTDRSRNKGPGR